MSTVYSVVKKYQETLSVNLKFTFSCKRPTLGRVGEANRLFVFYLCSDKQLFLEFLKETGLIMKELRCEKCYSPMKFSKDNGLSDGYIWYCDKMFDKKRCSTKKSIRKGSWFFNSKLKLEEIFLLTYEIVRGTKTTDIESEYHFNSHTLTLWRKFVNQKMLDFVEFSFEKVGGSGKIVEVGISNFGRNKKSDGCSMRSQWVFGGVERVSGKLFLVAIDNNRIETLVDLMKKSIKQGTTIYLDAGSTHIALGSEEFNDLSVNYNLTFSDANSHTNTIRCMWRHIESSLPIYNRQVEFKYYIAIYLFNKHCEREKIDTFNTFLEFIINVNLEKGDTAENFNTFQELVTEVKQELKEEEEL